MAKRITEVGPKDGSASDVTRPRESLRRTGSRLRVPIATSTVASDDQRKDQDDRRQGLGNHPALTQVDRAERPRARDASTISARSVITWSMVAALVALLLLVGFFAISSLRSNGKSDHGGGDVGVGRPQDK